MVEVEWPEGAPAVATVPVALPVEADAGLHYVCAPMVATLYLAPSPGADPFVREGDRVVPGQQVAILEAMKMMIPVEADRAGEVVKVLVPNATPVEYGERLIALAVSED
ncbi:acetyl-CoA carboxylase biotin carboxyl carrier protein [Micromonospora sp. NPDC050276]|uniref:acetyl-CoA carboxylase biotin carboxyl carrier protein n=1 Tax=Micromonospora sp. NPDC050276 TaxID=3364278 RepID=UPI00379CAC98